MYKLLYPWLCCRFGYLRLNIWRLRLNKIDHDYFKISLEFDAYIYERGLNLGKDGAILHYAFIGDLEKYNLEFAKIFQTMHKDNRAENLKTIREYFENLKIFFKCKNADSESIQKNLELIEQLGFNICRDEHGVYLIANSKKMIKMVLNTYYGLFDEVYKHVYL